MAQRILLVEDEPDMKVILRDNLEYEGYEVLDADTGEAGVELALRERPDLILLDVMLPKMSGYEVCRRLRAAGLTTSIVMLTARNAEIDRITGLEFGADDYIGKPFSVPELLARVRVQLRRLTAANREPAEFCFGEIVVNLAQRQAQRAGQAIDLSSREFDLLRYFIAHREELVTRQQLLSDVWGYNNLPLTRTVDNFVAKLRRKIEPNPQHPLYIVTVHGAGYRFSA